MSQAVSKPPHRQAWAADAGKISAPIERVHLSTHGVCRMDVAVEVLVGVCLAFMPFALGTVDGWSELVANSLISIAFVCVLVRPVLNADMPLVWTKAYVPVLLFISFVLFQLLPLPPKFLEVISPEGHRLRSTLLADLPGAATEYWPISLYPHGTVIALRGVLVASMMFFIVVNTYRRSAQIKRLLAAIAGIGFVVALLALAQDISQSESIYWSIKVGKAWAGPYVNHNNFAQFMNLSIGAALALLLILVREGELSRKRTVHSLLQGLQRVRFRMLAWLSATIVLGAISLLLSGSRGGTLSLLAGFAVAGITLSSSRHLRGRGWIAVLIVMSVFCGLLYAGFDAVYLRLATLQDLQGAAQARWEDNRDSWAVSKLYLQSGVGLGTHELVFPGYAKGVFRDLGVYLENEYLQLIEEMGLPGVVFVLTFLAVVGIEYVRSVRFASLPVYAGTCGLGFAVAAVMVGSVTDFGQRLSSIGCLTAVVLGLIVVLGTRTRSAGRQGRSESSAIVVCSWWPRVAVSVSGVLIASWVVLGSVRTSLAESAWARVESANQTVMSAGPAATSAQYAELLTQADAAASADRGTVQYAHWLNAFRWQVITHNLDQLGTTPLPSQVATHLRQLIQEYESVRRLGPTYGPAYCVLGQIQIWLGDERDGRRNIQLAQKLRPSNATICFVAGRLAGQDHDYDKATTLLKRAVSLGYSQDAVIGLFEVTFKRPELMSDVFGDSPTVLRNLAKRYEAISPQLADVFREKAANLLIKEALQSPATLAEQTLLGDLYSESSRHEEAANLYKLAILQEPGNTKVRLKLAQALFQSNQRDEAVRQIQICLRFRPQWKDADRLLQQVNQSYRDQGIPYIQNGR